MLVAVATMREPTTGLYVDIQERKPNVRLASTCDTVADPKYEPRGGSLACKLWDVLGSKMKGTGRIVPVFCRQVNKDLQGVDPGIGPRRFVMQGAARGLEPIEIARRQIEVIAQRVAVAKHAYAVLKHHGHS